MHGSDGRNEVNFPTLQPTGCAQGGAWHFRNRKVQFWNELGSKSFFNWGYKN